ncbi:MAG: N-6 DNA methylase, partial [Bacteroidota bacterium]
MNKKNTGAYYTPVFLANFISKRVLSHFEGSTNISILEPSVGDGVFVSELSKMTDIKIKLSALDINQEELDKASEKWNKQHSVFTKIDFLEFSNTKKFSAIIGNPPYLRKSRLSKRQLELSKGIHLDEGLSEASVKNIWTAFLIKSNKMLNSDGVLAFVLPSELLQVKFAEEIREYLKKEFTRLEIFTFNDLMFECKGQDTIVLFAFKKSNNKGEFFANIDSAEALKSNSFSIKKNKRLVSSNVKWIHHSLTEEELTFIYNLKKGIQTINTYVSSKPGIVTAANNFFIIDRKTEKKYNLSRFTKPIIQNGLYVNGSVIFNNSNLENLETNNYPTRLLVLKDKDRISKKLREYLALVYARCRGLNR